jgi:hypothetical protein
LEDLGVHELREGVGALLPTAFGRRLETGLGDPVSETSKRVTLSGKPPEEGYEGPAPAPIDPTTGMHKDYWVLSQEERAKGFVRPVRTKYIHEKCGSVTRMGLTLSETYAREPSFYGATYCATCKAHFPVGAQGEFVWDGTDVKVGT